MGNRLFWGSFFSLLLSSLAVSADLDVGGAKARYEQQRAVADGARRRYDAQKAVYDQAVSRYQAAKSQESQAVATLDRANRDLRNIDDNLTRLEREISALRTQVTTEESRLRDQERILANATDKRDRLRQDRQRTERELRHVQDEISHMQNGPHSGDWTCVYVDDGFEEHSGGHRARNANRSTADADAKAACLAVHGSCRFSSCFQPDPPGLQSLKDREERLQQDLRRIDSDLSSAESEVSSAQNQIYSIQNRISQTQNQIRQKQDETYSLSRDRDRQVRVVDSAQADLRNARNNVLLAQQQVDSERPPLDSAKADWDREEVLAQQAYAYYQQVQANYNAALNDVYQRADVAAAEASRREASERAPQAGATEGSQAADTLGTAKGNSDAAARDRYQGYLDGRAQASTAGDLSASYARGIDFGKMAADLKARSEKFPLGYNESFDRHYASLPSAQFTVDISEEVPQTPGGSGQFLDPKKLVAVAKPDPSVTTPAQPTLGAPAYSAPGVSVPASLKPYYNPPCSGLVLPEFGPLCLQRYERSYFSSYDAAYQELFTQKYREVYLVEVGAPYQQALQKQNLTALADGRNAGAYDQGILNGFAEHLEAANVTEFSAGTVRFKEDLKQGAYLVFREATLEESSGDGVFTPGEKAKLRLVVDNYGLEASRLEAARFAVKASAGVGEASFQVRGLPSLAPYSRTTLTGVVTAPITTKFIGEKISLQGTLEASVANQWVSLAKPLAAAETHFPLELSEVTLPKAPKVDETLTATLKFTNQTKAPQEETAFKISSEPAFVIIPKPDITVGKLEAGATTEVALTVKPGVWVGENTFVGFAATNAEGVKQVLPKYIHMDRAVSLLLTDAQGKPVPNSTLVVTAGQIVSFYAQLVYHAKVALGGPFIVRAGSTSTPTIPFANNATTGINYGSLRPGVVLDPVRFSYVIPQSYKGKQGWIMILAQEGNKNDHALMVYLDVR